MVQDVENFPARLNPVAFLEREVLEDGHVPVLETLVAEDVATHVAVGSESSRDDERFAIVGNVAPCRRQRRRTRSNRSATFDCRSRLSRVQRLGQAVWVCDGACSTDAIGKAVLAGGEVGG